MSPLLYQLSYPALPESYRLFVQLRNNYLT